LEQRQAIYRVFNDQATISAVFFVRDRLRFARSSQAHGILALLHKAKQGAK
jgi:hypothetical protein